MNVLDLDLDFFLNDVVTLPYDIRPDSKIYKPWNEDDVVNFLEMNCNLSKESKIPGQIVTTHDEVFYIWRDLIASEELNQPFNVTHIDAHADLGMGDASFITICTDIVHRTLLDRFDPPNKGHSGIYEGNYLAYALACRWISKLTYVRNPKTRNDLLPIYFKDQDINSGLIRIPKYDPAVAGNMFLDKVEPVGFEPDIEFQSSLPTDFQIKSEFDFMFLAKSPKYTPPEADTLVDVIQEYIDLF